MGSGSAYIFHRDGTAWTQQAKLTANDAAAGDWFGWSVSLGGEYAIIGATRDSDAGPSSGSAYIFKREGNTWTQQAKLTASDAAEGDFFGGAVSLDGDYAIVGAYDDDEGDAEQAGSAYIFEKPLGGWSDMTETVKLKHPEPEYRAHFGQGVSISGDYAIAGAPGSNLGAAYIFVRSGGTWLQQAKLMAADPANSAGFGCSVSIQGTSVVVGSLGDDDGEGSAYPFRWNGSKWIQKVKVTASDAAADDWFGFSVSLSGDHVIIGADGDDHNGKVEAGSAYIYSGDDAFKVVGDLNGDGVVDLLDFRLFAAAFGYWKGDARYNLRADLDGDGKVWIQDFYLFVTHFGEKQQAKLAALARELLGIPLFPELYPNIPNPFNPLTLIAYDLPEAGDVKLTIYAITGQKVTELVSGYQEAGHYEVMWDGSGYANGVYLYRLEVREFVQTRRMALVK